MRVLHVITALGVGGAERMLLKLLTSRALSGMEQCVITMLPGGAMAVPIRGAGVRVDEFDFLGGVPVLGGTMRVARRAREFRPDVVHGWLYHGNLGAAVACAALPRRVPLIWSIRQSLPTVQGENLFARAGILLNRMGSARPDRLLFNSRESMAEHQSRGFRMDRAAYLPNGFDTEAFAPNDAERRRWREAWNARDETTVFGMFARYHPAKDHAGFLEAARQVRAARPAVRFVMAGSGVDRDNVALARSVRDAGLSGCVHLLGERRDVPDLLVALDVYVSSSARIEAFSNSVGEAMSCGVPCVVTSVGDSPGVVADTGRVVPPKDPAALADAMVAMVDLGKAGRAALGARARGRVVAEFAIEAVAGRYAALYADLAGAMRMAR